MAKKTSCCDFATILSKSVILRIALGGMLFVFGYTKLNNGTQAFVDAVLPAYEASILPGGVVEAFLTVMPTAEAVLGVALFFGLFTAVAARLTALLFALYIVGLTAQNNPNIGVAIIANFIYIFATFKVICAGDSPISLDYLLRKKMGKK